ncbi:MAG: FecR domain-containing protein [Cytophagales bacterium]|nr:FecR domain-containing protein [Cytophagales bacterium]MDW8384740.1 FecR domain-containing protein [Flammeovirgaceae bacterium]
MNSLKEKDFWIRVAESLENEQDIEDSLSLADEKHAYKEARIIWDAAGKISLPDVDVESAFTKIQQKAHSLTSSQLKLKKWWKPSYAIAASVAFLLLGGVLYFGVYRALPRWERTYSTSYAERRTVLLADGSKILLNAGTSLKVANGFNQVSRKVYLDGEAYFEIAKNEKVPFVVQTTHSQTDVLGTIFNIKAYSNESDIELEVIEGKVKFSSVGGNSVILTPNKGVVLDKRSQKMIEYETSQGVTWFVDVISFQDETLANAASYLSRWYNVTITVEESIRAKRITARFHNKSIQEVLDYIKMALNIECSVQDKNTFHLFAKKK